MKRCIKSLIIYLSILLGLFGNINLASADTTPEIEVIFNWAEDKFPALFPNHQPTQMVTPWTFRFYSSTGIYAGVKNGEIFVLGGPWGNDAPTMIDTVVNLTNQIAESGDNGSGVPGCNSEFDLPAGLIVTKSGNVVNPSSSLFSRKSLIFSLQGKTLKITPY